MPGGQGVAGSNPVVPTARVRSVDLVEDQVSGPFRRSGPIKPTLVKRAPRGLGIEAVSTIRQRFCTGQAEKPAESSAGGLVLARHHVRVGPLCDRRIRVTVDLLTYVPTERGQHQVSRMTKVFLEQLRQGWLGAFPPGLGDTFQVGLP